MCGAFREVPVRYSAPYPGDVPVGAVVDVAVVSPTDAWLVAGQPEEKGAVIFRWTGVRWSPVPMPVPDFGSHPLGQVWFIAGLAAVSANEVWAVGGYEFYRGDGTSVFKPLIERWDGTRWRVIPVGIPTLQGGLYGVSVIPGSDDLWAVGARYPTREGVNHPYTLVLRWDGQSWHRLPTPDPSVEGNILRGVSASRAGSAWAVGEQQRPDGERNLILRWDGRAWRTVPVPDVGLEGRLGAVAMDGLGHAWSVGTANFGATTGRAEYRGFVLRWGGTTWKVTHVGSAGSELDDIVAASPTSVWAVGARDGAPSIRRSKVLVLHSAGVDWRRVAAPDARGAFTAIDGTPHNLWVGHTWVKLATSDLPRFDTHHRC